MNDVLSITIQLYLCHVLFHFGDVKQSFCHVHSSKLLCLPPILYPNEAKNKIKT